MEDLHPWLDDEESGTIRAEARAELLLRTHGFQAYQAAAHGTMERQKDVFPYWQYKSMEDGRVRPAHAALDGIVLPANHEFWKTHFPPWQWGCRCQCIPLSEDDYADIAKEDEDRAPDHQLILDDAAQAELTKTRRLVRNGVAYNVSSDAEKGKEGAYAWHPDNLRPDLTALQARTDPHLWQKFETFAKAQQISPEQGTVWEWLHGHAGKPVPPAPVVAIPPVPVPPSDQKAPPHEIFAKLDQLAARYAPLLAQAERRRQAASAALAVEKWSPRSFAVYDHATATLRRLKLRRQREAVSILTLPPGERTTVRPGNVPRTLKPSLERGFDFLGKVVHPSALSGAPVEIRRTQKRACADPLGKYIDGKTMDASTVIHEIGHIIETRTPAILRASVAFRNARTVGETPQRMPGYKKEELALPDKWVERGGSLYSGKVYTNRSGDYATEILSMGMERLFADVLVFAEKDRTYFEHAVLMIRGEI